MKAAKLEKWMLLEQSGELSPARIRRLNRVLASSQEARELRDTLNLLKNSVVIPDIELPPWTVRRIAARLYREPAPQISSFRILRPAAALAAGLMLAAGIFNFHGEQNSSASSTVLAAVAGVDVWNDPLEEDLGRLENLIVAISGDPLDIMEM